ADHQYRNNRLYYEGLDHKLQQSLLGTSYEFSLFSRQLYILT
ncbi:20432_t:CDS:1, partial [Dentiscutata erythropus]